MFRSFLTILYFVAGMLLHAQKEIAPEFLTIENGLSQSFVSSLIQDQEGFIWMGTKNGLNRFDGRNFEIHTKNAKDNTTIIHDNVLAILDDDGFILIGTLGGVGIYQKSTKKFHEVKLPNFINTDLKPEVLEVVKDPFGNYWLSEIVTKSLYKLKFEKAFYNTIHSSRLESNSWTVEKIKIEDEFIPNYICVYNGKLFFLTRYEENDDNRYAFSELDLETKRVTRLNDSPLPKRFGTFWFKTYKDLLLFSIWGDDNLYVLNKNKWHLLKTDFPVATFSPLESIGRIMIDSYELKESLFFDEAILSKKEIKRSDATSVISGLKTHSNDVLVDSSGVTWIATAGNGVMKITPRELNIETLFTGKSIYAKPFVFNDTDLFIDNPTTFEKLFVIKSDKKNNRINKLLENNHNCFFTTDKNNGIWGLVWHFGKYRFGYVNEAGNLVDEIELPSSSMVLSPQIKYNGFDNEIIIAYDSKLFAYSIDDKKMLAFDLYEDVGDYNRYDITKTSNGNYWIGTSKGLIQCNVQDAEKSKVKLWNDRNGLLNNEVSTLLQDSSNKNVLWIGTKGGGLHQMNLKTQAMAYHNVDNGLPNNVIYGILEDEKNNLWMSSNHGIIVLNKETRHIRNYTKADGLQSNEFNTYAYAKTSDGEMCFGGINGLNVFHPDDFENNDHTPKVWITGLEVNNERITTDDASKILSQALEKTDGITLPYSKNSISLEFVALEFTAPKKNRFSYYMEGLEKPWIHDTEDNEVNYLSMPPGNYTFKIKAANGDGIWTKDFKSFRVRILSPWYRTNLAYMGYVLITLSLFWVLLRFRERTLLKAQQIEKSELENKLLKAEITYKQKDLVDLAFAISENQKWGSYLLDKLKEIRTSRGQSKGKQFDELENDIKNKTLIETNKVNFQDKIDRLNNEFYQSLLLQYPKLSKTDLRLCTLIRLDFSTNDIAMLQNIEQESVYMGRKRLRKKLNLTSDVGLDVFLKQF